MRIKYMTHCFGCCELRTAVILVSIFDVIFGLYDVIDFGLRAYYVREGHIDPLECLAKGAVSFGSMRKSSRGNWTSVLSDRDSAFQSSLELFLNKSQVNSSTFQSHPCFKQQRQQRFMSKVYQDTAFVQITVGICDLVISTVMFIVVVLRKHSFRFCIYIAAIWGFVMGFLVFISFAVTVVLRLPVESAVYFLTACIEIFCSYVVLSYYKQVCHVMKRDLLPQAVVFVDAEPDSMTEMRVTSSCDQVPILDDQDDN